MALNRPADVREQYRDSSNLGARINLHARFSTSPIPWPKWMFDRLELQPDARVLEVGCGPGLLWRSNADGLPRACCVTLTDFSPGMVNEARSAITDDRFAFSVADAQRLPFADASFDVLVANHMLYHVHDLDAALAEFARVLRSGGRLFAATNGRGHMPELATLLQSVGLAGMRWSHVEAFGLETGVGPMERHFEDVRVERLPSVLAVTDAQAVLRYIESMPASRPGRRAAARDEILRVVSEAIDREDAFRITTDAGIITGRTP